MVEIEFIKHDEAGFIFSLNDTCNLTVLCGYALGAIDHKKADVCTSDGSLCAHGGENFYGRVHLSAAADTGGINEGVKFSEEFVRNVYSITSCSSYIRYDGALVFENGIDKRRFSSIGFSYDSDLETFFFDNFFSFFDITLKRFYNGIDGVCEEPHVFS